MIKNEKHTAILGKAFTAQTMVGKRTYKKGFRVPTYDLFADGAHMVEGHGVHHVIPRRLFTKYIVTWDEVKRKGNTTMTVKHTQDETQAILRWWAQHDAKALDQKEKEIRTQARHRIAELRRQIKEVKNGTTQKELDRLLQLV